MSDEGRTTEFGKDLLRYLRRDSILYLQGSQFTSPAIYNRYIRNIRPDVILLDTSGNLLQDEIKSIYGEYEYINKDIVIDRVDRYYKDRRYQAMSYPRMQEGLAAGIRMRGPFFYHSATQGCDLRGWDINKYGFSAESLKHRDLEMRILLPILEARMAECGFLNMDAAMGLEHLRKAVGALETSSHVRLYAGQLADRYGYLQFALEYYEQSLELCPTYTDAMIQKAQLMLEKQGSRNQDDRSFVGAEEIFRKALDISPENLQARLSLANIASINEDYEEAEKLYLGLIESYPASVLVHVNLANLYLKARRLGEALNYYEIALAMEPESSLTILNFSSFMLSTGRLEDAKKLLVPFVKSSPDSAYGQYNLGLAFHGTGDYNDAVVCYRKAVEAAPRLVQGWENLILVLLDLGRFEEAREVVDALSINGDPRLGGLAVRFRVKLVVTLLDSGRIEAAEDIVTQLQSYQGKEVQKLTEQLLEMIEKAKGKEASSDAGL